MRAINDVGPSAYSLPISVISGTIPGKALTPITYSASVSLIQIRWDATNDGGSAITDYKVLWDSGLGNGEYIYKASTAGYQTFQVPLIGDSESLIAGRTYSFKVIALNGVGEGPISDELSVIAASKPVKPPTPTLVSQSPT